jgi:hypothetical protein
MGLYSFQPRFTQHILSGRKKHTIRNKRKDGWVEKPGNTMYLYENVRTKNRKHIANRECMRVEEIIIGNGYGHGCIAIGGHELTGDERDALAYADGFEDMKDMLKYWDGRLPFEGFIIHWQ